MLNKELLTKLIEITPVSDWRFSYRSREGNSCRELRYDNFGIVCTIVIGANGFCYIHIEIRGELHPYCYSVDIDKEICKRKAKEIIDWENKRWSERDERYFSAANKMIQHQLSELGV